MKMRRFFSKGRILICVGLLLASGGLAAYATESPFFIPPRWMMESKQSPSLQVVALIKEAEGYAEDIKTTYERYTSATSPVEKRFWLLFLLKKEMSRVHTLARAQEIMQEQDKALAEKHAAMNRDLNNPRIKEQIHGLKAMLDTLCTFATKNEATYDSLSSLLAMVERQYTPPGNAEERLFLPAGHNHIGQELTARLASLKKAYSKILQRELI